jgi:acetyl esterase
MYFHGGGFVMGSLDTCNNACHFLSKTVGCIVIAVDYRLAPKHKFPAAVDDGYTATAWAAEHAGEINGDSSRLAVVGESAGGNIAAAVCIMAQDRGGPPLLFQVLAYASTNLDTLETESYRKYATGYGFTKFYATWLRNQYIGNKKDRKSRYASPLLAENVSGVPPALVLTGEFDVLRDDGESYVKKLKEEGVPARFIRYADRGHMAYWMTPEGEAGEAQFQVAFALKAAFRSKPTELRNTCENCP